MHPGSIISIFDFLPVWATILPIAICSVIALAVIIERMIFFSRNKHDYDAITTNISDFLKANQPDKAKLLCDRYSGVIIGIIKDMINNFHTAHRERTILKSSETAVKSIEKNISILATIATISPMFGLFGTVTGMMKSFSALSNTGPAAYNLLANGIAEALVTTALGLLVAIPSWIFYNYMVNRVDYYVREIEHIANALTDMNEKKI